MENGEIGRGAIFTVESSARNFSGRDIFPRHRPQSADTSLTLCRPSVALNMEISFRYTANAMLFYYDKNRETGSSPACLSRKVLPVLLTFAPHAPLSPSLSLSSANGNYRQSRSGHSHRRKVAFPSKNRVPLALAEESLRSTLYIFRNAPPPLPAFLNKPLRSELVESSSPLAPLSGVNFFSLTNASLHVFSHNVRRRNFSH